MMPISARSLVSLAILSLLVQTEPAGSIEQVATLHTARAAHTATRLSSGQVLIVGGMAGEGGALASAEIFDPARNTAREFGSLRDRRVGHTATLLGDGRVLIAGGYNGDYLQSLEIFDPASKQFRLAGTLVEARSGHTATLVPNGRVLFVGGVGRGWTFLRSAEIYDPATGRSESAGSMSVPRESHTATLLPDGRVIVIGGHNGRRSNMQVFASAEIYSPLTQRFQAAGTLATPRHKHDAVALPDGRVLVVGGADASDHVYYSTTEIYNPSTNAFEEGPTMNNQRYKIVGTSVLLPSGDVLVTSGAQRAELLDHGTGAFREISGTFPEAYRFATATMLTAGDVLIVGGYSDRNERTGGVWRFRLTATRK